MKIRYNTPARLGRRTLATIGLLALCLAATIGISAYAQSSSEPKVTVFIDKDRNANIQIESQSTKSDTATGTVNLGLDLASGLGTFVTSIDTGEAGMKGVNVNVYGQMDNTNTTVVGNFKAALPTRMQKGTVSGDLKGVNTDKAAQFEGHVSGQFPAPPTPPGFSHIGLSVDSKTDYKTASGTVNFAIATPQISKGGLKNLDVGIADTDPSTTSIDFSATVDMTSMMGMMFKSRLEQIKQNPKQTEDAIKGTMAMLGVTVTSVTISKTDVNDKEGTLTLNIKLQDLRKALSQKIKPMVERVGGADPKVMDQAIDNLLALSFTRFGISARVANDALTVDVNFDLKNIEQFANGCNAINLVTQEQRFKRLEEQIGDNPAVELALRWWRAVQAHLNDVSQTATHEMATDGAEMKLTTKWTVDVKEQISFDGTINFDMGPLEKLIAAFKAKGFPTTDGAAFFLHIKTEGGTVSGSGYGSVKGNLVASEKSMFIDPARQDPQLKPAADMLSALQWEDGRFQVQINDSKVLTSGFFKTSDLTQIVTALQSLAAPSVAGTPTGARFDIDLKPTGESAVLKIGYRGFETGKSDDEVKQLVSKLNFGTVTVNSNADAASVTLAKLEQPKAEMPSDLAAVKSEGDGLLAAGALPSMPSGGGPGGHNMGVLVGVGIAVLALLAIVMMSAGKKGA